MSRSWGWFQARTAVQKVLIVLAALVVLVLLSRVVWVVASVGFKTRCNSTRRAAIITR